MLHRPQQPVEPVDILSNQCPVRRRQFEYSYLLRKSVFRTDIGRTALNVRSWPGPGAGDRQMTGRPPRTSGLGQGDRNREYQESTRSGHTNRRSSFHEAVVQSLQQSYWVVTVSRKRRVERSVRPWAPTISRRLPLRVLPGRPSSLRLRAAVRCSSYAQVRRPPAQSSPAPGGYRAKRSGRKPRALASSGRIRPPPLPVWCGGQEWPEILAKRATPVEPPPLGESRGRCRSRGESSSR